MTDRRFRYTPRDILALITRKPRPMKPPAANEPSSPSPVNRASSPPRQLTAEEKRQAEARAIERQRRADVIAACGGDHAFALQQIASGATPAQAATAYAQHRHAEDLVRRGQLSPGQGKLAASLVLPTRVALPVPITSAPAGAAKATGSAETPRERYRRIGRSLVMPKSE
jgi:hypothetical protein